MTNTKIAKIDALKKPFMLVSNEFGYNIYAAHVAGRADVEITDIAAEAARFDGVLNDAAKMAKKISKAFGYKFSVVPA